MKLFLVCLHGAAAAQFGTERARELEAQPAVEDFVKWDTEQGKGLLGVVNMVALPKLVGLVQSADIDPVHLDTLGESTSDIGIGSVHTTLKDVEITGIHSIKKFDPIEENGPFALVTGAQLPDVKAKLTAKVEIKGAEKEVCVMGSCHSIVLPPLFGATVSHSPVLTATLKDLSIKLHAVLMVNKNGLILLDNDNLKAHTLHASCSRVDAHLSDIDVDVQGFDDEYVGKHVTDLVVSLFKDKIRAGIVDSISTPVCSKINEVIKGALGHN